MSLSLANDSDIEFTLMTLPASRSGIYVVNALYSDFTFTGRILFLLNQQVNSVSINTGVNVIRITTRFLRK